MKTKPSQTGDTIVEVLIAIAVVALVLGSAYAISNRSLGAVREAQEHSEGLKLAEAQIESLKQMSYITPTSSADDIFNSAWDSPTTFCITNTLTVVLGSNALCTHPTGFTYTKSITRVDSGDTHTFTVLIQWPDLHGKGIDKLSIVYRLKK